VLDSSATLAWIYSDETTSSIHLLFEAVGVPPASCLPCSFRLRRQSDPIRLRGIGRVSLSWPVGDEPDETPAGRRHSAQSRGNRQIVVTTWKLAHSLRRPIL
jgi:hypothetical protein